MSNELYTVDSVKAVIKLFIELLDVAFPGVDLKVGIRQGARLFIDPWFIEITSDNQELVRIPEPIVAQIDVRVMLDHIDHGGEFNQADYALGLFSECMTIIANYQPDPAAFLQASNRQMTEYMRARGIEPLRLREEVADDEKEAQKWN